MSLIHGNSITDQGAADNVGVEHRLPYTARDTRLFAQALNLTPCFTPVASPQSNGMSEAYVKTLKRDYFRIAALPDAETALRLIDRWIEDYNEIHPHSALKMASPRQFIRAKSN